MKKIQLKIPVILPQVPNEKDTCVERLIKELQAKEGIEKVHVADTKEDDTPQLCFHYDPDIISIDRIQSLAERTGANITYTVYLESTTNQTPSQVLVKDLTTTSFSLSEPLDYGTDFKWYVIAKDSGGNERPSTHIYSFKTKNVGMLNTTKTNPFLATSSGSTVVFNGDLWFIGGENINGSTITYSNEVWRKTGTGSWNKLNTSGTTFSPRSLHSTLVFDNKIWVIGGFDPNKGLLDDVWYSSDGINWTEATSNAGFGVNRHKFSALTYNNKMWIIGGSNNNNDSNDVWYSTDGVNWTEATSHANFPVRKDHKSVVFDNKMYVIGGSSGTKELNDVWYSTDGVNWVEATDSAAFSPRLKHSVSVLNNKMFLIGGLSNNFALNDVWYSYNGIDWKQVSQDPNTTVNFIRRHSHSSAAYNNSIIIFGGYNDKTSYSFKDTWVLFD